jgi:glutaredoxin
MQASRGSLIGLVLLVLGISAASQWWNYRQEAALGRAVAALAAPGDLHMLSSDSCGICVVARHWFGEHGVRHTECSIERDAACRQQYEALGAAGTPVILVRGRAELGFSPTRLHERLKAS